MDGSREQPKMTAGLDLGDKYCYLCLIDTQSGEVIEEGRLRTTPEALRRRFASEQPPMRIAIEAGTHSPWVSRLLEGVRPRGLGGQRPQAEAHLRQQAQDRRDRRREPGSPGAPGSEAAVSAQAPGRRVPGPHGLNPLAAGAGQIAARSWSTTFAGRSSPSVIACPSARPGASTRGPQSTSPRRSGRP